MNSDKLREYHLRRISFQDKRLVLPFKPRTGKCSACGKIGKTHLHHEKYDPKDPLAHTVELCISCHMTITWQQQPSRLIRNQYMTNSKIISKIDNSNIIKTCERCNVNLIKRPNETNRIFQNRRFCSTKCIAIWHNKYRSKSNGRFVSRYNNS